MAKKVVKEVNDTIIKVPISKFIDTQFRSYALYVLEARGIPSFYDALTNIQRYILNNCPTNFVKTLSVVGKCIDDHYPHGNSSLESGIARITRPFGNSMQLLEGYGFFGTEVCPLPSAARYTSVKLASNVKEMIYKYKHLISRIPEGPYNYFWLDCPIGLSIPLIGIAVGYKTMVLPRKIEEVQKYLSGKKADLTPYMQGFNGTIKQYQSHKNWLLQGTITIEGKKINVTNMPPILKYTSVLKKIDVLFAKYDGKLGMENNSKTTVNITFNYRGNSQQEFDEIIKFLTKTFSVIVTENIVFIKDSKVIEYDNIQQYLDDWKWQKARLDYTHTEYLINTLKSDINFNEYKEKFIEFMISKKRTVDEIDEFYKHINDSEVVDKLDKLTAKKFTNTELEKTRLEVIKLKEEFKQLNISFEHFTNVYNNYIDPTTLKTKDSKKSSMSLFDISDIEEIDGIMVWNGEDQVFDSELDEMADEITQND